MNNVLAFISDDSVITTSILVAKTFGKLHKNVIRDIESLCDKGMPQDFYALNFEPIDYIDKNGDLRKAYNITKDGFTILAMGYTGKIAMEFKIAFVSEFNRQTAQLKQMQDLQMRIAAEHSFYALNSKFVEYDY